ncbi:MAG: hypothetical protein ACMUIE_07445 [Thermoplasmatota archaeon]
MRCERCGTRMEEEWKESFLRGTMMVFYCYKCGHKIKESVGPSPLFSILNFHNQEDSSGLRRARPIDLNRTAHHR